MVVCLLVFLVSTLVSESTYGVVVSLHLVYLLVTKILQHLLEEIEPVGTEIHPVFSSAVRARHVERRDTENIAGQIDGDGSTDTVACTVHPSYLIAEVLRGSVADFVATNILLRVLYEMRVVKVRRHLLACHGLELLLKVLRQLITSMKVLGHEQLTGNIDGFNGTIANGYLRITDGKSSRLRAHKIVTILQRVLDAPNVREDAKKRFELRC